MAPEPSARDRVEWPTVAVAAAIAAGFATVLAAHERLPMVAVLTVFAVLGAWYNSLQHEVIHDHPTPWRRVNTAFGIVPLGLVVPFRHYRRTHLAHHRDEHLTEPGLDPESFYVDAVTWARHGPSGRALLLALRTLAGRMVLGPLVTAGLCWSRVLRAPRTAMDVVRLGGHVAAVAAILLVVQACGVPAWAYVAGVAWGGSALSLLRSFAEHRQTATGTRSAVVRSGRFFSLLYLNNNLHHSHHAHPSVAWYRLPAVHASGAADDIAAGGAGLYRGYAEVARRYLVRPFDEPVHRAT